MGTAAQFGGMGMSAGGAYKSAVAQKIADRTNAKLATDQASQAIIAGQQQEQSSRLQTAQVYGQQRAALGANGVDLGSGSATDILASTKVLGNRDALTIHDNALRVAWGYQAQAAEYKAEAAQINPWVNAFGSLLGSASSTQGQSAFKNLGGSSGSAGSTSSGMTWGGGDGAALMDFG